MILDKEIYPRKGVEQKRIGIPQDRITKRLGIDIGGLGSGYQYWSAGVLDNCCGLKCLQIPLGENP